MCQIPHHGGVGLPRGGDLAKTCHLEHVPQDLYRKILSYECSCPGRGFGHGFPCQRSHWIAWMSTAGIFWDPTIPGGHCIDINADFRSISLLNVLTDIEMLVLPQPLIWTLQITRDQKIELTSTFLTGSLGLIASIFLSKECCN